MFNVADIIQCFISHVTTA